MRPQQTAALEVKQRFIDSGVHAAPAACYAIACLLDADGRIVTTDGLTDWLEEIRGYRMTYDAERTAIKHARKALSKTDWGWQIVTEFGFGYRIKKTPE